MSTHALTTEDRNAFRNAGRVNRALTARLEKRALTWMAERAPQWLSSDQLTLLGLGAQIAAGACYALARWDRRALLLAILCLALNWLGDSLDGTLARVRQCQRPRYGFYVDHMVDALGTFFLLGGMALSGYMSPALAGGLTIAYFLLSIEVYLATYTIGTFHISFWKFSPTELRILLMIGNLALLYRPMARIGGYTWPLFDLGGTIGICGMAAMLVVAVARHTVYLYRAEPLPGKAKRAAETPSGRGVQ
jgi:archaetidylinositol phosphate synthase